MVGGEQPGAAICVAVTTCGCQHPTNFQPRLLAKWQTFSGFRRICHASGMWHPTKQRMVSFRPLRLPQLPLHLNHPLAAATSVCRSRCAHHTVAWQCAARETIAGLHVGLAAMTMPMETAGGVPIWPRPDACGRHTNAPTTIPLSHAQSHIQAASEHYIS